MCQALRSMEKALEDLRFNYSEIKAGSKLKIFMSKKHPKNEYDFSPSESPNIYFHELACRPPYINAIPFPGTREGPAKNSGIFLTTSRLTRPTDTASHLC